IVKAETNPTKNASSEAPVPVIKRLADALEAHRTALGVRAAPDMPIFQNGNAKPLNLDNLALRMIKPAIEKCVKCHKLESDHKESDHPYELDKKTKFFGFHAYRRGLASNLHALGVPDLVIQKILRHSNVATTQAAYIKTTNEAQIGAMETLNTELQRRDSINESGTLQTRVIQ
ncbi:MAG TPA: tyrosine-type recombinase/integrase, partial [Candidatus Acidoferrales bacterium]